MFYNKSSQTSPILLLAAAFSLPPKMLEYPLLPQTRSQSKEITLSRVEKWGSVPNLHGGVRLNANTIDLLNPSGQSFLSYPIKSDGSMGSPRETKKYGSSMAFFPYSVLGEKKMHAPESTLRLMSNGELFLDLNSGPVERLWKIFLKTPIMGAHEPSRSRGRPSFTAWSSFPATLLYFDWGLREDGGQAKLVKILWDPEGDLLLFQKCSEGLFVVVERLASGMVQISYLKSRRPENFEMAGFSRVNVSSNLRFEELSAVRTDGCRRFYFVGTFGLMSAQQNQLESLMN